MIIQANRVRSLYWLKSNLSEDFELNDLASSCIINAHRKVRRHWMGQKKKIINLILNVLLHYIECLSTMYVQLTFGKWPDSWKLKYMNSGVYKMSTVISTSRVHIED